MLEAEETRKGGGRNCSNSRRGIVGGKMEKKEGKRGREYEARIHTERGNGGRGHGKKEDGRGRNIWRRMKNGMNVFLSKERGKEGKKEVEGGRGEWRE